MLGFLLQLCRGSQKDVMGWVGGRKTRFSFTRKGMAAFPLQKSPGMLPLALT